MASEKERVSFPNESPEYRSSRDRLLQAEIELRRQLEDIRTTVTTPSSSTRRPSRARTAGTWT